MSGHRITFWETTTDLGASCAGCGWAAVGDGFGGAVEVQLWWLWASAHPDAEPEPAASASAGTLW